jgi:hypothetical protein
MELTELQINHGIFKIIMVFTSIIIGLRILIKEFLFKRKELHLRCQFSIIIKYINFPSYRLSNLLKKLRDLLTPLL